LHCGNLEVEANDAIPEQRREQRDLVVAGILEQINPPRIGRQPFENGWPLS
jgi:hypothetical protein